MPKRYVNIKLPEKLAKEINKLVEKTVYGYRSEFITEAVR